MKVDLVVNRWTCKPLCLQCYLKTASAVFTLNYPFSFPNPKVSSVAYVLTVLMEYLQAEVGSHGSALVKCSR